MRSGFLTATCRICGNINRTGTYSGLDLTRKSNRIGADMGLRKLLLRLVTRWGGAPDPTDAGAAILAETLPEKGPDGTRLRRAAGAQMRFRPQICCETRQVASLLVVPPPHLDGDADAILRQALQHRRDWVRAGLTSPPLAIELPRLLAESPQMAQPLTWEIDRQDCAPEQVIFTAPSPGHYTHVLDGLALLSRHGCGIELDCLDPMGMAVLRDLRPLRGRMRVPPAFLPDTLRAPGEGQHILSLLALAERHGLATVVDDVRSRAEFDYLALLGFSVAQGDGVARMMDADACTRFLTETQEYHADAPVQHWPAA